MREVSDEDMVFSMEILALMIAEAKGHVIFENIEGEYTGNYALTDSGRNEIVHVREPHEVKDFNERGWLSEREPLATLVAVVLADIGYLHEVKFVTKALIGGGWPTK